MKMMNRLLLVLCICCSSFAVAAAQITPHKTRHVGSKDPITGELYRIGDMLPNKRLGKIVK